MLAAGTQLEPHLRPQNAEGAQTNILERVAQPRDQLGGVLSDCHGHRRPWFMPQRNLKQRTRPQPFASRRSASGSLFVLNYATAGLS